MWDEEIIRLQNQIEDLKTDIRQLDEQIEQSEDLLVAVDRKQNDYIEACRLQKQKVFALRDSFPKVCFAVHYGECVGQLLSGTKQRRILECYDELIRDILDQKRRLENEIEEVRRQVEGLEYRLEEAERQRERENMQRSW